jgi:GAF domain-containing protein
LRSCCWPKTAPNLPPGRCCCACSRPPGAERGFVVVREGQGYEQKFDVRYDRARCSEAELSFSRSLVRHVLATREIIDSPSVLADPRFRGQESVQSLGEIAVLVVPLAHGDEVWGVLYLQRQGASFPTRLAGS